VNGPRSLPPQRVPTLTEVVEPLYRAPPAEAVAAPQEPPDPIDPLPESEPVAQPGIDEAELIERVLGDLQRQVELMLEYRLREVLTPALVRATDALIRDARVELASTLRDVVARAVAVELSRHRGR
jgi:hypothetical protein